MKYATVVDAPSKYALHLRQQVSVRQLEFKSQDKVKKPYETGGKCLISSCCCLPLKDKNIIFLRNCLSL
jgi:hypothetical protein